MRFAISGDGSLGYWSRKTSHYSFRHHNDDDEVFEEEVPEVYLGEYSRGHRYQDNSQSSSSNHGGHGCISF